MKRKFFLVVLTSTLLSSCGNNTENRKPVERTQYHYETVEVELIDYRHSFAGNYWHDHYYEYIHHDTGLKGTTSKRIHVMNCKGEFEIGDMLEVTMTTVTKGEKVVDRFLGYVE